MLHVPVASPLSFYGASLCRQVAAPPANTPQLTTNRSRPTHSPETSISGSHIMPHIRFLTVLGKWLSIQSIFAFERWKGYPQFEDDKSLGRVALVACILSTILGVNMILCLQLVLIHLGLLSKDIFGDWTDDSLQMALQWAVYACVLCTFHLGEFFTTAVFNPTVTSADSFMV